MSYKHLGIDERIYIENFLQFYLLALTSITQHFNYGEKYE